MNSINENGCSVCQPGKENYTTYNTKLRGKRVRMYQYDYRMFLCFWLWLYLSGAIAG